MAAGCDDLVRKPFHEQELFEALARHLRLKFIYEEARVGENTPEAEAGPESEQLALPAELLRGICVRPSSNWTRLARIPSSSRSPSRRFAGQALTLATRLDYKRLLKLLEKSSLNPADDMSEKNNPPSTPEDILVVDDTPTTCAC